MVIQCFPDFHERSDIDFHVRVLDWFRAPFDCEGMGGENPIHKAIALCTNVDVGFAIFIGDTIHVAVFPVLWNFFNIVGLLICAPIKNIRENSNGAEVEKIDERGGLGDVGQVRTCRI